MGVVPLLEEEELEELPQPTAVIALTERTTARRAPQRRRRGRVNRSTQARVAPEPATYHGVRPRVADPPDGSLTRPFVVVALLWEAVRVKAVVAPVAELITTGDTEKTYDAERAVSATAERAIEPVNPLKGVSVKVTAGAAPPVFAVVDGVQGVSEKSAFVAETISVIRKPFDPA